jgi:hypothetical protein
MRDGDSIRRDALWRRSRERASGLTKWRERKAEQVNDNRLAWFASAQVECAGGAVPRDAPGGAWGMQTVRRRERRERRFSGLGVHFGKRVQVVDNVLDLSE